MAARRRIDQLLSSLGYCTRKEAQLLCDAGRVRVAGEEADDASQRVDPAGVTLDGEPLDHPDGLFAMLHKPVGYVCSHDEREGALIYELLPERWRLRDPRVTSVGRLDKETSGLVLLTDQGTLVQRLTSPRHHVDKVYVATLDGDVTPAAVEAFAKGMTLEDEDEPTLPATLRALGPKQAEVTMREGRYHQVRRMFAACGLHVSALHRVRFGEWALGELPVGKLKDLALP